jgi:hypothetical protein
VDLEDLRLFLSDYAQDVTVREVKIGPQMSVDWFLPPTVDLIMSFGAAHPFIVGLLGSVSGSLTSTTAKKIYEKFGDALIKKAVDKFCDHVGKVFKRAKNADIAFHRGDKILPVPPLRITFELNRPKLSKATTLALVFPADLTDAQIRDALSSAGKVVEAAIKRDDKRARYEKRARKLIVNGKSDEGIRLLTDEEHIALRRTSLTYAYHPDENAWVDAWVLADQAVREQNAARLREWIKDPPAKMRGYENEMKKMVADIEKYIRDGRVR